MKLETKIRQLINQANPDTNARFDVVAFELWGNAREGFDCNNAWHISRNADLAEVLEASRARWEIFKVNYMPKARVCDIVDIGALTERFLSLDVGCVPFLEIRIA